MPEFSAGDVCVLMNSTDQRRRLRDCLFRYVDSTEIERNMMALGKVPGFATYWKLRASVGGVGPLIGMTE